MSQVPPSRLPPGMVVSVPAPVAGGLHTVAHFGLVSDRRDQRGMPFVYNSSKRTGRVLHEPWDTFTQGETATYFEELTGTLHIREVLARAKSKLGEEWRLFGSNCEHFVRWCHGLEVTSPQVKTGLVVAGGLTLAGLFVMALANADE